MSKLAFVFPGQGVQHVGMAEDFYEKYEVSREIFERASFLSGLPIKEICFVENERINQTRYTQPALLTAECAVLAAVLEKGIKPDVTAGLSLGEYSALVAARALTFDEAIGIVRERGIYMEKAVPAGQGKMAAVITKKDHGICVEEICAEVSGVVTVANYNCPTQQVISGESAAVDAAMEKLAQAGAKRVVPLKVSGPFHSPLLASAGEKLGNLLEKKTIKPPDIPFISNVTADPKWDAETIRSLLARQVHSPVRWQQSVECMLKMGVDTFVEIGPGRTLAGFISKIEPEARVLNVETVEDLENVANAMEESK